MKCYRCGKKMQTTYMRCAPYGSRNVIEEQQWICSCGVKVTESTPDGVAKSIVQQVPTTGGTDV